MLNVVWALTVNNILWMAVWNMTLRSAVHTFQSLIEICSLHFERKCYYVSIKSDGITSIKNKNLPWGCLEHATHSELQTFPTWTPPLHLHRHPRAKYLSALCLLLCNLKYRKYKQLSDMLRYIKYTVRRAEQCSETGDSGFMGHHPVSFGWWFTTLQRNVVPSSSSVQGPLLHGSWSLEY